MNTHQSMASPSESTLIEAWRVIETLAEDATIMEMSLPDAIRALVANAKRSKEYLGYAYSTDPYTAMCQAVMLLPASSLSAACAAAAQELDAQASGVDTETLDWLESETKASRTGVSLSYCRLVEDGRVLESGFQFMRQRYLGPRVATLREAINAARNDPRLAEAP